MTEPILRLENVRKTFPGVIANDQVYLDIRVGEIHALLGENGAGKSTLMNCLYGVYRPDGGKIFWKGKEVDIYQARDAIALGIGMVHQHFKLVPPLTVTENVVLGLPSKREPFLDVKTLDKEIGEIAKRYGFDIDPTAQIWQLPVGVQQRVEILKALYRKAELLILDEPTAVLTPQEVEELFSVLKNLTKMGLSIIFITHKLEEVMAVCDRVTVLRLGKVIDTVNTSDTSTRELAKMMVGREVFMTVNKPELVPGEVVLKLNAVSALDNRGLKAVNDISLEVRRNEILGIAGVDGNGQTELAEVVTGLRPATGGKVEILGKEATNRSPLEIMEMGVAYIPPDRQHTGLLMDFSITENLIGKSYYEEPISKKGVFQKDAVNTFTEKAIKDYDVRTPGPELKAKSLSGGNQQKVVLARELSSNPDLLVAAQPVRGLDVGATEYVHDRMVEARSKGAAILLISTELEEILSLSDRIAVMFEGKIMGILPGKNADIHEIGAMMAGVHQTESGTVVREAEKPL
ncbi:MAG: ABC transporter ATP-binding protein [Anaerolineaceae bacterium]|nr:ABC transporter ATP-binding protein [Anaerolineaceae bacterium]